MEPDCIFCQIVHNQVPAERVYEDERFIVIKDIKPKAPVHLLIITREHIPSLLEVHDDDGPLMAELVLLLPKVARNAGLKNGFRSVVNAGPGGGQEVHHLHFHILGGGPLAPL